MARTTRLRHGMVRRVLALSTLVLAAGGLLALEHTPTGATTVTPSHAHAVGPSSYKVTTKPDGDNPKSDHNNDKPDPQHHKRDCTCADPHGRHHKKLHHCRPPSGARSSRDD